MVRPIVSHTAAGDPSRDSGRFQVVGWGARPRIPSDGVPSYRTGSRQGGVQREVSALGRPQESVEVLIVDDEVNMRHTLKIFLERGGYIAESAAGGIEALEYMDKDEFDYIL